jgi:SAM-dependent methyltransferase
LTQFTAPSGTIAAYEANAVHLAELYESVPAALIHAHLVDLLPPGPGLALDVGAGSGRDAAWLVSLGYDVVAAEPAAAMRREGMSRHPEAGIRWIDDRLPDLSAVHRLGLSYDVILASAVWMHVPPPARPRAFRKLATLLKPGGILVMTLRQGPPEPDRVAWSTPAGEVEALARSHGVAVVRSVSAPDHLQRPDVSWTQLCLRLPDDGAGALPLLRGIILNDDKSATYKLALLRSILRVADGTPSLAIERPDEDAVDLPLGMVALNWVRMFLPLVCAGLPQRPGNSGASGLGFAKEGFRTLSDLDVAAQELRYGAQFTGERAAVIGKAIAETARHIERMPANFTRYPNSTSRVFEAAASPAPRLRDALIVEGEALTGFGTLRVPGHVWRAMQRMGAWIEPVLVAEWARMMREYGERMGIAVKPGEAEDALTWIEPARDTLVARQQAQRLLTAGASVQCVWTGARLGTGGLDIDHCLPWSAWPCGDLWNLMPASPRVNQRIKRDRLPSAAALAHAHDRIMKWWEMGWLSDPALAIRFEREAVAALPVATGALPEDIFTGLEWRRLRLRQDQQVEEWAGLQSGANSSADPGFPGSNSSPPTTASGMGSME